MIELKRGGGGFSLFVKLTKRLRPILIFGEKKKFSHKSFEINHVRFYFSLYCSNK